MNERLFELIEETVAIYMKRNLNGTVPARDYLFQEIFTELIVRECIDTVLDCSVEYTTRPQIARELKDHFGVKE
jgi:hypothetical protein